VKQQVVEKRRFKDLRLAKESVAEFMHRPTACSREYRVVVLVKELEVHQGQQLLFDDSRCFFYITNDFEKPADEIVFESNCRSALQNRPPISTQNRPPLQGGVCRKNRLLRS